VKHFRGLAWVILTLIVANALGCVPVVSRTATIRKIDANTTEVTLHRTITGYGFSAEGFNAKIPRERVITVTNPVQTLHRFDGKTYPITAGTGFGKEVAGYVAIGRDEDFVYVNLYLPDPPYGLEPSPGGLLPVEATRRRSRRTPGTANPAD
jgi:hypothetical protein